MYGQDLEKDMQQLFVDDHFWAHGDKEQEARNDIFCHIMQEMANDNAKLPQYESISARSRLRIHDSYETDKTIHNLYRLDLQRYRPYFTLPVSCIQKWIDIVPTDILVDGYGKPGVFDAYCFHNNHFVGMQYFYRRCFTTDSFIKGADHQRYNKIFFFDEIIKRMIVDFFQNKNNDLDQEHITRLLKLVFTQNSFVLLLEHAINSIPIEQYSVNK